MLAGAVATLQELSNGRMFLGIGVGAGLEDLRIDYPRPVLALREAIVGIRGLLSGETVEFDGEMFPIDGARLVRPPEMPVPISVGTRSRQVMQLAGELADIALVGARHFTPEIAQQYYRWLSEGAARAGRRVADIDVAPRLTLCVSSDGELARRSVVRYVAHYLAIIRPAEIDPDRLAAIDDALGRATGWYFDLDRYDPPELFDLGHRGLDPPLRRSRSSLGDPRAGHGGDRPRVHECQPEPRRGPSSLHGRGHGGDHRRLRRGDRRLPLARKGAERTSGSCAPI